MIQFSWQKIVKIPSHEYGFSVPQVALALEERDVFRFSQEQAGGLFCIIQLKFRKQIFCLSGFDILIYNFMFVGHKAQF